MARHHNGVGFDVVDGMQDPIGSGTVKPHDNR